MQEREAKLKADNDQMINRIEEILSKDLKSVEEKEALKNYFFSKQQEISDNLIIKQTAIIETLQLKCQSYENDFQKIDNIEG